MWKITSLMIDFFPETIFFIISTCKFFIVSRLINHHINLLILILSTTAGQFINYHKILFFSREFISKLQVKDQEIQGGEIFIKHKSHKNFLNGIKSQQSANQGTEMGNVYPRNDGRHL